jgi:hypothetical protein
MSLSRETTYNYITTQSGERKKYDIAKNTSYMVPMKTLDVNMGVVI